MKKFQVITKNGCPKCETLKAWLKQKNLKFEEWKIEDQKIVDILLKDEKFVQKFCDIDGCAVYTPVIRIVDSGEYFFKELFGIEGIREPFIKKLLAI